METGSFDACSFPCFLPRPGLCYQETARRNATAMSKDLAELEKLSSKANAGLYQTAGSCPGQHGYGQNFSIPRYTEAKPVTAREALWSWRHGPLSLRRFQLNGSEHEVLVPSLLVQVRNTAGGKQDWPIRPESLNANQEQRPFLPLRRFFRQ